MKKLEAKQRLQAKPESVRLTLTIDCEGDAGKTLINLLGVIQWNCNVGHSAVVGAFFDGDGWDKIKIEGLPEGDYKEMAEALSSYGDGHLAQVGPKSAIAWNEKLYDDKEGRYVVTRTKVYPE